MNYELRTGPDAKIKTFTDLNAWKEAYKLALMIYTRTKEFPKLAYSKIEDYS